MAKSFRVSSRDHAGTFGTFRVRDRDGSSGLGRPLLERKRQRKTLSCDQCHSSKLKCDRARPCARCVAARRPTHCTYHAGRAMQTPDSSASSGSSSRGSQGSPEMYFYNGNKASSTGRTHWVNFVCEDVRPYLFGREPDFRYMHQLLLQLRDLYPPTPSHSFPFVCSSRVSRAFIIEKLPAPGIIRMLVENYLSTFDKTHPLMLPCLFLEELSALWTDSPDLSHTWLAQLLMALSLSCQAASYQVLRELRAENLASMARDFSDRAAESLGRAPFMDFPDICSIRVLCMMAIERSMNAETPETSGGLWALEGLIVRLAMSMSLHRDPITLPPMSVQEAQMRRRVWNTIVFFDLNVAISSGLPVLVKPTDWDTAPPTNLDDADLGALNHSAHLAALPQVPGAFSDSFFQVTLARVFPVVSIVLSATNSPTSQMSYDTVLDCNEQIRQVLRDADATFASALKRMTETGSERKHGVLLQQIMLEIFLRRTLLALHLPYDNTEAQILPGEHATSHWSVLECSLALLRAQHILYEEQSNTSSMRWVTDLFQRDFGVAMMCVISGLRRQDFVDPFQSSDADSLSPSTTQLRPRALGTMTACAALQTSFAIIENSVGRSFHLCKIYMGVVLSLAALGASDSGCPLAEAMKNAAQSIANVVQRSREQNRSVREE